MPFYFFVIAAGVFGTVIGSFLNVVALRYNTGRGYGGRSACASCAQPLKWFELIPVVSFVLQRGRCRTCRARLSRQYPIVELATGILFALAAYYIFLSPAPYALIAWVHLALIVGVLLVITVYDIRHTIIPDMLVVLFGLLAFLYALAPYAHVPSANPISILIAGAACAAPFALLWLVSGGRWMGLGDAKLSVGIGFMLGLIGGFSAIVLAFWIGALWSVFMMLYTRLRLLGKGRRFTMKSEVPFGPFLVIGFFITLFFSWDLLRFIAYLAG